MHETPFPYDLGQLNEAMDHCHERTWAMPPEIRYAIQNELGGVFESMIAEHHVRLDPTSALGRAVFTGLGVSFQLGLEIGHLLAKKGRPPAP